MIKYLIAFLMSISLSAFAQNEGPPSADDSEKDSILFYIPNVCSGSDCYRCDNFAPIFYMGFKFSGYSFIIYDRWGEIVFESIKHKDQWYCEDYSAGTYIWELKFTEINGKIHKHKGHVTVLK